MFLNELSSVHIDVVTHQKGKLLKMFLLILCHASKKRRAHEMVRKINKNKRQSTDPLDEVVQETDFDSGSDRSLIHNEIVASLHHKRTL